MVRTDHDVTYLSDDAIEYTCPFEHVFVVEYTPRYSIRPSIILYIPPEEDRQSVYDILKGDESGSDVLLKGEVGCLTNVLFVQTR